MPCSRRVRWPRWPALAFLSLVTTSFAGDSNGSIEPAFPAGSCTWFVVSVVTSDAPPDVQLIPATLRNAREMRRELEHLERLERRAPDDRDPRADPRTTWVQDFTVTVWSDGRLEATPVQLLTRARLDEQIERLEAQSDPQHGRELRLPARPLVAPRTPAPAPGAAPVNYPPGELCHARTASGRRCSRTARGDTGFCWQHQSAPDAFPNK